MMRPWRSAGSAMSTRIQNYDGIEDHHSPARQRSFENLDCPARDKTCFLKSCPVPTVTRALLSVSKAFETDENGLIARWVHSPPFSRRGGCAINKKIPFLSGADGVVSNSQQK